MALSGAATVPKSRGYQIDIRIFGSDGMLLFDIERARVEAVRQTAKAMSPTSGPKPALTSWWRRSRCWSN